MISALPRSHLLSENPPGHIMQACAGVTRPVIVFHCQSGKNRSPVGCLALLLRAGIPWDEALTLVKKHPCEDIAGFRDQEAIAQLRDLGENAPLLRHALRNWKPLRSGQPLAPGKLRHTARQESRRPPSRSWADMADGEEEGAAGCGRSCGVRRRLAGRWAVTRAPEHALCSPICLWAMRR